MVDQSLFRVLPDELVLKIIAMASSNHDFIVDIIAEVSERFKLISSDRSLWRGNVRFCGHGDQDMRVELVTEKFLNDGITKLNIFGQGDRLPVISRKSIMNIAAKCPNLVRLSLPNVISWPTLNPPLRFLRTLTIESADNFCFMDVDLNWSVPCLRKFELGRCTQQVTVPDLKGCKKLNFVRLMGEGFKFRLNPTMGGGSWRWYMTRGAIIGRILR